MQLLSTQGEKIRLNDAAFVMAFLRPWIRKIEVNSRNRFICKLCFQHFDGVVNDEPEIADAGLMRRNQAMADAGFVDFNTKEVLLGMSGGQFDQRVAVAKTNFNN